MVNFTTADGFRYTAGLGYFADGRLAEIFLNAEKIGTAIETPRNGDGSAAEALSTLLDLHAGGRFS